MNIKGSKNNIIIQNISNLNYYEMWGIFTRTNKIKLIVFDKVLTCRLNN